ncbi:MAG: DUF5688 family protein [Lachnospiraceae bacterium]|nr:DUF5688 family protein [Lachnospiraceae bacterium]
MSKMNFDEFKQAIADQIKDYLPEKYQDMDVVLQQVAKNNDTMLDAVMITGQDSNVSPAIYVNGMYEDYQNGCEMDSILKQIADIRVSNDVPPEFDLSRIMDYDQAKDHIVARLVNLDDNRLRLENAPYTRVEDLAVTYHIDLKVQDDSTMSVQVMNPILESFGITREELHEVAMVNTREQTPPVFKSLMETMRDLIMPEVMSAMNVGEKEANVIIDGLLPSDDANLWVLTNSEKIHGAVAMLDTKMMDEICEQMGGDIMILPSSIHESIIVPKSAGMSLEDLESMVQEINATDVRPEDRLSDHVYAYDSQEKVIYRADQEETRQAEKSAHKEKGKEKENGVPKKAERGSLKDRMKDKQKQVDASRDMAKAVPGKKKDVGLE